MIPRRRAPSAAALATSSITATRAAFGLKIATTSTSCAISRTLSKTRHSPNPRSRTDAAIASGRVRDVIPTTSSPRTDSSARKWKPVTNPAPTIPYRNELVVIGVLGQTDGQGLGALARRREVDHATLLTRLDRGRHQLEHVQRQLR